MNQKKLIVVLGISVIVLAGATIYFAFFSKPSNLESVVVTSSQELEPTVQPSQPADISSQSVESQPQETPKLQETTKPQETPKQVVKNFYDAFIGPHSPQGISDVEFAKKTGYLTGAFADKLAQKNMGPLPIICAQEIPNTRNYQDAVINKNQATLLAHHVYEHSGDNVIEIHLQLLNDKWLIDDIICSKN